MKTNYTEQEIMEEMKKSLHYDHYTGWFTWLVNRGNAVNGRMAGTKAKTGYIDLTLRGKHYLAHRLAFLYMTGKFPKDEVDHINGVKDDNRWVNLREATRQENNRNCVVKKNNKLGIKGVKKNWNKYRATGRLNGKEINLGFFATPQEASNAYQRFAKQNHGDFHCERQ